MKLLIVDTATSACSVAVTAGGQVVAESLVNLAGPTSSRLAENITQTLAMAGWSLAELDGFAVTVGPGAFTGLRVGLAAVKGMALATGKPIAPISSLQLLAANLCAAELPVCPLFDARKGEVYAGCYRCDSIPFPLQPDRVVSPADFLASITEPTLFVGDGAVRYRALIEGALGDRARFAPTWANTPRAAAAADLVADLFARGALQNAVELTPVYLRLSEAETARQGKR